MRQKKIQGRTVDRNSYKQYAKPNHGHKNQHTHNHVRATRTALPLTAQHGPQFVLLGIRHSSICVLGNLFCSLVRHKQNLCGQWVTCLVGVGYDTCARLVRRTVPALHHFVLVYTDTDPTPTHPHSLFIVAGEACIFISAIVFYTFDLSTVMSTACTIAMLTLNRLRG